MTDENSASIPMEAHPDPVLEYVVEDGRPLVTGTNDAFDTTFEGVSTGTWVSDVFDRFASVEPTGEDDLETHVANGDPVGIYLDTYGEDGAYFVRIVATDNEGGYLVFVGVEDCLNLAETAGVGQVASVISHDLRNPLDVAKAHLQAARETGDPEHFEAVGDAHERMSRIIRDVLTLARRDGVVDPSERVSIETAVEDAWESVDTDGAALTVSDTLPTTTADPDRLRRLLENLFRNAVEHGSRSIRSDGDTGPERRSTNGRSEVTVTVGTLEEGFYVADDGPGIPPEEHDAVFDPGYTTDDRGAGLGLAIVDRIVDAHGWDLTLTAARNGGARFEVRF